MVLASGSQDRTIRIWDLTKGESFRLTGHTAIINQVYLHEQDRLFSCSDDEKIRIWNWKRRECLYVIQGHVRCRLDESF
jgi:WD40 repeat protein